MSVTVKELIEGLFERLKKLEKVAEAARKNIGLMCIGGRHEGCNACAVSRALKELDGKNEMP